MCCDRPPKCEAVCQSGSDLDGNMSTLDAQSSGPAFHRHNINTGTRTEAIANNNIFLLLSLRAIEAGEGGGEGETASTLKRIISFTAAFIIFQSFQADGATQLLDSSNLLDS